MAILGGLETRQCEHRFSQAFGECNEPLARIQPNEKVAIEVCHDISSAIQEHDKRQREVRAKYDRMHEKTLGSLIGAFIPLLAPFVPIAAGLKYAHDKRERYLEERAGDEWQ